MKKRVLVFLLINTCTISMVTVSILSSKKKSISVKGLDDAIWYHYSSVEPTRTRHGSKEFWMNCSTLSFSLERPQSENIFEGQAFDNLDSFFSLNSSDERYVAPISAPTKIGNNITYGIYPQTHINNSSLISSLNSDAVLSSNGWYLYKGEYYAKISATPYKNEYKFYDGVSIKSGSKYWFKCEPITWKILSDVDGYFLLSNIVLDSRAYYSTLSTRTINGQTVYPDNYVYSDIRIWLNEDFYNHAFVFENSNLLITEVNNSGSTTDYPENPLIAPNPNTFDKVFMPSYSDYKRTDYGFGSSTSASTTRCCKTTDWAIATGTIPFSDNDRYVAVYWTRSPAGSHYNKSFAVGNLGSLNAYDANTSYVGIRPSIRINF